VGWRDRIKAVFIDKADDWIFEELTPDQIPNGSLGRPIKKDKAYVTIRLRSMRVVNVRQGLQKFYGAVHSFVSLGHLGTQKAEFQVLTTPTDLRGINPTNLHRVLCFDKDLLTSVPYRGGGLEIEFGLYSIKGENLTDTFLKVLEGLSDAAGVSFVSTATPFVKPLSDGIDLLLGTTQNQILEIGLSTKVSDPKTGTFVVMRAPASSVELSKYKLDEAYRLVDKNGDRMGEYPYIVYSIESDPNRENWYEIPEISKVYNEVNEAARKGDASKLDDAVMSFKRIVLTSPDLTDEDQDLMIEKMEEKVKKIKKTLRRTRLDEAESVGSVDLGSLKDLNLYS
jgi:hypothetical protein